uniref:Uncharacterized protein n=1 Tax=Daucus carota subsp. sativus TaxID=79200 RepID=A0A161ZPH7_DAUCS
MESTTLLTKRYQKLNLVSGILTVFQHLVCSAIFPSQPLPKDAISVDFKEGSFAGNDQKAGV